jgi:phosphopantetheinyl transferase (holo-ACP synthase)
MIGIGIDAVNVQRFRDALDRTPSLRSQKNLNRLRVVLIVPQVWQRDLPRAKRR